MRLNIETEVAGPSQAETRRQLLEAAAEVFAEAGFQNATVREICRRADANIAAINYHFGDKEKLYAEVIRSSHAQTLEKYPPLLGLAADAPPEKRLRAYIHSLLLRIFDHGPTSCHGKLMLREMIEPTGAMDILIEERIRPMSEQLWKIVGEILNRPAADAVVRQCAMSVVSQCVFYKHCGAFVSRLAPEQMPKDDAGVEKLADHITEFSLAALKQFRKSKTFCPMKKLKMLFCTLAVIAAGNLTQAADTNSPAWLTRPLSVVDALNTALLQNASILKAKSDFEDTQGLVIQTRAVALPQVTASGRVATEAHGLVQDFPGDPNEIPAKSWSTGIQITQTIYDGGKSIAALRSASTTKKQSLAVYQTAVEDTLLSVRLAYYDVLLAAQQVTVHEASVNLLQKELEDQQHRLDAGTVPKFNVLRAEVAVANERPNLIQAKNNYRITKNNLSNLLGYNLPREVWEDVPLNLIDGFDTTPLEVNLPDAIQEALSKRTELEAARRTVDLQKLNVTSAKSGYQPQVQAFAGYNWDSSEFNTPLGDYFEGWDIGAQLNWAIFDGGLTYGKVKQAKADLEKSKTELADQSRQIELQVRTAYSDLLQARETLDSQQKVQEEAEEALREANARSDAGTGTQLDVLDAETALTQARTTLVQSQHDYVSAVARYQRAIGSDLAPAK
ncbi:MAG TPA: CerR family C-terminal domain-containing protein [Candidatus Sulfotelmatobacter sp.]|nr:CerR family C-terminal domain-containing protein [Candidatus Sulfotelmatobacter sp.]